MNLIKKLTEAPEGDRELDRMMAETLGWTWSYNDYWKPPGPLKAIEIPRWTTSLDAVKELFPAGWEWKISNRAPAPLAGRCYANNGELIYSLIGGGLTRNPKYRGFEETAYTPELAACAVLLQIMGAS